MPAKKLLLMAFLLLAAAIGPPAGVSLAGQPVMTLTATLLPDYNMVRVTWEAQPGVAEYTVERWEARGTNYWHFDLNERVRPGEKNITIGGQTLTPQVFVHKANSGTPVEFYDQEVKPACTYFYRVNGGTIAVRETRSRPVTPLPGQAAQPAGTGQDQVNPAGGEVGGQPGSPWGQRQKEYEKTTDYPERLAADLVMALPNWLIRVIGLHDPLELVFGVDLQDSFKFSGEPAADQSGLVWNIYSSQEFRVIGDFYHGAGQVLPVFLAVGVALAGLLVLLNSTSPHSVITARGYILGILLCALLIKLGPYLLGFFFEVNRALVALCHSVAADEIQRSFLHSVYNQETRSLGAALLALIGCLSIGVINFQFALRKVFIAVLVGLLPIALVNAIFPGRRNALAVWVREFTAYVFMPAGLAVGLSFFVHFLNSGGFWVTLACLLSLPAINGLVRGVLGISDSGFASGVGSALGMGAIFSLGGILGGGEGKAGPGRGAPLPQCAGGDGRSAGREGQAGPGGAVPGELPGMALGKAAPGLASLAGGALAGAVGLGVAGGIVAGAAGGDSSPGLQLGAVAGRISGRALMEAGGSAGSFFGEVRQKGFQGATGVVDRSLLLDPGVAASLATRVLGDNPAGRAGAAVAASTARAVRGVSPLVAPQARERLDLVSQMAGAGKQNFAENSAGAATAQLGREFERVRQMQQFRQMFQKIQDNRHSGGTGGINGSSWR